MQEPDRKRHKFTKKEKIALWQLYVDPDVNKESKCPCCCTEPITIKNHDIGHIVAFSRGGSDNFNNLRPICGHCNKSMGAKNMIEYQRYYHPFATPISPSSLGQDDVYINMDHIDTLTPIIVYTDTLSQRNTHNRKVYVCIGLIAIITIIIVVAIVLL